MPENVEKQIQSGNECCLFVFTEKDLRYRSSFCLFTFHDSYQCIGLQIGQSFRFSIFRIKFRAKVVYMYLESECNLEKGCSTSRR